MRPTYVRQLAAELEMLSHGNSTSWNAAGGNGIPDSRQPSGESKPPHELFLAEWDRRGDAVLEKWLSALKAWKGGGQTRPEGKSEREIVLDAGRGHAAEDVAQRFRCTPSMVRRWRREDGVNEDTGVGESLVSRAQRLRAEGVSVREVAARVGRHPTQVQRWTKAA